jgi:zinc/manganese transport system substrate-binding protein
MKSLALACLLASSLYITPSEAKTKAVASFSILGNLVAEIGGNRIEVTTIVGPGADAHVYEPKPTDAQAMAKADVVFVNGLGFEGFQERLIEASGFKKHLVVASRGITALETSNPQDTHNADDHSHEHDHGVIDPHAWHDIGNAKTYIANIADGLCKEDADGCDTFKSNAQDYVARLDQLDSEIKIALSSIPADQRIVITSHDAFAYLGRAYNIRFLAPEGASTESEASAKDVVSIIRQIRTEKARALFVENIADPRLLEQIASETALQIGGELFSDALSSESGPAPTYLDLMRHNTTLLAKAMVGS